jgi:hypothetical protein
MSLGYVQPDNTPGRIVLMPDPPDRRINDLLDTIERTCGRKEQP